MVMQSKVKDCTYKSNAIFYCLYSYRPENGVIQLYSMCKMFKTQVEPRVPGEWFHWQVLNIL